MWFDPTRLLQTFDLVFLGSPVGKESACKAGDQGSIPGSGRSPGEGNGNPVQDSCLENPMDGGAWWATVHKVAKESDTTERLNWTELKNTTWASQLALVIKNPPANAGDWRDVGLIPESGRSSGEGHGNPVQDSCLENPMDRGTWRATVCRVRHNWSNLAHENTTETIF